MGEKITCAICRNEKDSFCKVKKNVKVAVNKRRRCDSFILAPEKVKEKQILKTVRLTHSEKEALRKYYKEELRRVRENMKNMANNPHPLTGDLSRFTSTVSDGDDD